MTERNPLPDCLSHLAQRDAKWRRYQPNEMVVEFDAPVAAISPRGVGRVTYLQCLNAGDRFCYLPPLNRIEP